MKTRGVVRRWPLWAVFALLALGAGCSSDLAGPVDTRQADAASPPTPVRVVRPQPVDLHGSFPSNLYVERDVIVTPRTSGIVEQVLVDRGDRVRAGQPLAVLESDLHASEQRQAEQLLRLAEAEYERTRSLHDQDIVSAQEALRSEIERDLAGSEVELARARLERCTVRAPFDGIIVERWVVVGQRVLEEDNEQLFRVVADDPVRARIHVPEQRLPGLQPGVRATIALAGASVTRPAHVVFVSPAVDPASGTSPVIVEADAGVESHGIGASVNVRLEINPMSPGELSRLPRAVITDGLAFEGEQATVLLAVAGQARTRAVEVVEVDGTQVVVRGSFDPGDRVILQSAAGLADGEAIRVAGEESP